MKQKYSYLTIGNHPNISNISKTHHLLAFFLFNPKKISPPKPQRLNSLGPPNSIYIKKLPRSQQLGVGRLRGQGVPEGPPLKTISPSPSKLKIDGWKDECFHLFWNGPFSKGTWCFFFWGKKYSKKHEIELPQTRMLRYVNWRWKKNVLKRRK